MSTIRATFGISKDIATGLENGTYERVGGMIRHAKSKQIVMWLREIGEFDPSELVSLSSIVATASTLNLAISTMGFAVIIKRLGTIEKQLKQAQIALQKIDYKIDLSLYANFRAALDLATNAFTMANPETRRVSAMQAINRFLEAEHHYTQLVDLEIDNGSQVADDYLSTLCLAYVTEVRCYLELEELETAHRRLGEGLTTLRPRFEKHISTLLTSNPAVYLHPVLSGQTNLRRLTKIYQWLTPGIDESGVFEAQRENLFRLAQHPEEWINSLPQAILILKKDEFFTQMLKGAFSYIPKGLPGFKSSSQETKQDSEPTIYDRLPEILGWVEVMIEDYNRLDTYLVEMEIIRQLGMSFQEWRQLAPPVTTQGNVSGLMCITVS